MNFPKHQRTPQMVQYSQRKLNFSLGGALNFRTQFIIQLRASEWIFQGSNGCEKTNQFRMPLG